MTTTMMSRICMRLRHPVSRDGLQLWATKKPLARDENAKPGGKNDDMFAKSESQETRMLGSVLQTQLGVELARNTKNNKKGTNLGGKYLKNKISGNKSCSKLCKLPTNHGRVTT